MEKWEARARKLLEAQHYFKKSKMKTLFVSCVGSHMWGMESEESDVDLVEIYMASTRAILRGETVPSTIGQQMAAVEGVIYDIQGWEIGHLINLLIKGNVNAIWCSSSPLVIQPSPAQEGLKTLVGANLCRETYHSIKGMAESQIEYGQKKERIAGKGYRTALRTLNFGIELLSRGRLCFEPVRHIPEPEKVIEAMRQLSWAYEESPLPDLPDEDIFREFLFGLRLEEIAQEL